MKTLVIIIFTFIFYLPLQVWSQEMKETYLREIKNEMQVAWPKNRIINLVFHGHSVPAGYFKTPHGNTLNSYPFLLLKGLKEFYPNALINVIVTAKGGEHSEAGEKRFESDVLIHKPDVIFIDYILNDKSIGITRSAKAMESMVKQAIASDCKVILLGPSPHQNAAMKDSLNYLEIFLKQTRELAEKYRIGFANPYNVFKNKILHEKKPITDFMSQVNHPNKEGHQIIATKLLKWF